MDSATCDPCQPGRRDPADVILASQCDHSWGGQGIPNSGLRCEPCQPVVCEPYKPLIPMYPSTYNGLRTCPHEPCPAYLQYNQNLKPFYCARLTEFTPESAVACKVHVDVR